jgi:formate dehydrogenase major subunit
VLITGRQLEHWHTGSMTRRAEVLHALEPAATASRCTATTGRLGLAPGDVVRVASRAAGPLQVRRDDGTPIGTVFIPFAYREAAANLLTNPGAGSVRQDPGVQVLRGAGGRRTIAGGARPAGAHAFGRYCHCLPRRQAGTTCCWPPRKR